MIARSFQTISHFVFFLLTQISFGSLMEYMELSYFYFLCFSFCFHFKSSGRGSRQSIWILTIINFDSATASLADVKMQSLRKVRRTPWMPEFLQMEFLLFLVGRPGPRSFPKIWTGWIFVENFCYWKTLQWVLCRTSEERSCMRSADRKRWTKFSALYEKSASVLSLE